MLETCSLAYLQELFVRIWDTKLKSSLETTFDGLQPKDLYMLVREKTHVMLFLEIFVRRIDSDTLKGRITKTVCGHDAENNTLIRYLIKEADRAKCEPHTTFLERCAELTPAIQLPHLNSLKQVARRYACAGYTLLSSTILKT